MNSLFARQMTTCPRHRSRTVCWGLSFKDRRRNLESIAFVSILGCGPTLTQSVDKLQPFQGWDGGKKTKTHTKTHPPPPKTTQHGTERMVSHLGRPGCATLTPPLMTMSCANLCQVFQDMNHQVMCSSAPSVMHIGSRWNWEFGQLQRHRDEGRFGKLQPIILVHLICHPMC